mmetsp:Transcript_37994/g.80867  ORF Transcript_37994/g.80867 Transcript_37994/m.80867 type:complete len:170 (-) Transcript_37994:50-559(-)
MPTGSCACSALLFVALGRGSALVHAGAAAVSAAGWAQMPPSSIATAGSAAGSASSSAAVSGAACTSGSSSTVTVAVSLSTAVDRVFLLLNLKPPSSSTRELACCLPVLLQLPLPLLLLLLPPRNTGSASSAALLRDRVRTTGASASGSGAKETERLLPITPQGGARSED